MTCHLQGLSVLVTRPTEQSDGLCELIEKAHGRPVRFPAMEIVPVDDQQLPQQILAGVKDADLLIFISANAVIHAFPLLPDEVPLDLPVAAIGAATANQLEILGLPATLLPEGQFDSEGLLALGALQNLEAAKIIIVRGKGGREHLRQALEQRGAGVEYAEVYERRLPQRHATNLVNNWDRLVDVVTVTSSEMLDNLLVLLGEAGRERLCATPLVVLSERTAAHARELGCARVLVAEQAGDRGILQSLCEYSDNP